MLHQLYIMLYMAYIQYLPSLSNHTGLQLTSGWQFFCVDYFCCKFLACRFLNTSSNNGKSTSEMDSIIYHCQTCKHLRQKNDLCQVTSLLPCLDPFTGQKIQTTLRKFKHTVWLFWPWQMKTMLKSFKVIITLITGAKHESNKKSLNAKTGQPPNMVMIKWGQNHLSFHQASIMHI